MSFDPTYPLQLLFSIPILGDLWWLWLFLVVFFLARSIWLAYVQEHFKSEIKWVMLEMRIPRELRKTPKAMEQVFMSIHAVRNAPSPGNYGEKWWDGEVTLWFSCEIVSFGGELHFYIRIPDKHRNMIEAAVYAQYQDIEIVEVEDYLDRLPVSITELHKAGYELFGNELKLAKPDPYPIRTYVEFEAIEEEKQLDPISTILETLAKIKPQEHAWLQILIQPVDDSWRKKGEAMVKTLKEKTGKERVQTGTGTFIMTERSPGEVEVMKAVERNIAKPGFNTLIRYIYVSPKELYSDGFARRGIFSALNQYASESLNKFKHNTKAWTRASIWYWPHFFPKRRKVSRQERIYDYYRTRKIQDETFAGKAMRMKWFHWGISAQVEGHMVLNVEELATIYHPPTFVVLTGPLIKRVEARKVGPPAGLPIYGEVGEELPGIKK